MKKKPTNSITLYNFNKEANWSNQIPKSRSAARPFPFSLRQILIYFCGSKIRQANKRQRWTWNDSGLSAFPKICPVFDFFFSWSGIDINFTFEFIFFVCPTFGGFGTRKHTYNHTYTQSLVSRRMDKLLLALSKELPNLNFSLNFSRLQKRKKTGREAELGCLISPVSANCACLQKGI